MSFIIPSQVNIGNNISESHFTSYLIAELVASGLYNRSLSSKTPEEQEIFKENLKEIWFKALRHETTMTEGGLTFAVTSLSAKRNWSDSQIRQLCAALNYDAIKAIKDNPHSWAVIYKS